MYMYILHVYKWVVNDNINGRGHASREAERLSLLIYIYQMCIIIMVATSNDVYI